MERSTSPASDVEAAEPFFSAEAFAELDALSFFKSEPSAEVTAPAASATRYLEIQTQVREAGVSQRDALSQVGERPAPTVHSRRRWFGKRLFFGR